VFGFLINEQPVLPFYWLALSTLLAFAQGDLRSPGSWVVAALAALTVLGLAVLVRRAWQAGPVLDRALADGLGVRMPPRRLPWVTLLLTPLRVRRGDVQRLADIAYGPAGRDQMLDVYRPRSGSVRGPVLVHLHGGGFTGGRKNKEGRPLLYRLAAHGWLCVSANYRLRPGARFPDQLVDVKAVIAWVREHAVEHGADPAHVFVAGSSAGGHLAAMAALTQGEPAYQPGFEDADTRVAGAIPLYGWFGPVYDDGPASSPMAHPGAGAPPVFVVHPANDTYAGVDTARLLVEKLRRESRAPVLYAELPGAQHTFDLFRSVRMERVVDAVESFSASVLASRASPPPPSANPPR
jgi:acetyl esterase/lipase